MHFAALAIISAVLFLSQSVVFAAEREASIPTVGMEGQVKILLPGTMLDARPVNARSNVVVRIADTRPHGSLIEYDLRYIGFVPGKFDLRDYLVRKDGSGQDDLPAIPVQVAGVLPEQHKGELAAQPERAVSIFGKYKALIITVGILWAAMVIPLFVLRRKAKPSAQNAVPVAAPSFAERLRPLVEQAADGKLNRDGQAQLERMLLSYWRKRLDLDEVEVTEAMRRLRGHPEAGALLRELENWLHRPPGSVKVDVNALLAPYRAIKSDSVETTAIRS